MKDILFTFGETQIAVKRTHDCGRELQCGTLTLKGLDQVHWANWICPKHGEVKPDYKFVVRKTEGVKK